MAAKMSPSFSDGRNILFCRTSLAQQEQEPYRWLHEALAVSSGERIGGVRSVDRSNLLFEERTTTRTDALPATVQGHHHRTRGVKMSGRRRGVEEESARIVTGL